LPGFQYWMVFAMKSSLAWLISRLSDPAVNLGVPGLA
jgi:hypothetical protein